LSDKKPIIKCGKCGEVLEENTPSCPKCGSKDRRIAVEEEGHGKDTLSHIVIETSTKRSMLKYFLFFSISTIIVIVAVMAFLILLNLFPSYVPISTANDLLGIIINTNGILLGFAGIIFAQLLSSIMDQQNVLFQSVLEKGDDQNSNKKKTLDFLDNRKDSLAYSAGIIFLFLLMSIFISMSAIAKNAKFLPTDTYSTALILFGPILFLIISVVVLLAVFMALPTRPPIEKINK
jgi:hypothetical protein